MHCSMKGSEMGTLPIVENLRVRCSDGTVIKVEAVTTTADLMLGGDGTVDLHGEIVGGPNFVLHMSFQRFSDAWLNRFCDALAANPAFRQEIVDRDNGDTLVVPAAPARDDGRLTGLIRKGKKAKFKDYVGLRSGRDRFSSMRLPDLEGEAGERACTDLKARMGHVSEVDRPAEEAKVLRWFLRGMPLGMAVRKVDVDREVSVNAARSRR